MKKLSFKLIAILLSVTILALSLPLTTFAQAISALVEAATPLVAETAEGQSENTTITDDTENVFEVVSLREETIKHFRLDDGTYVAAQYSNPVHYLDDNGSWQDIDNTLYDNGSDIATSNARVKFAKKITGNETLFTLHEGNHKITWGLDGAIKKTTGVAINTQTEHDESETVLQKMMTLDKLSSKVLYENILDGVDLEYIVSSHNVKENIIVKDKKDSYIYTFTMELNNLTAHMEDDGNILLTDSSSGEQMYIIPAPIAYDANNELAPHDKISYSLTSSGNGKYTLTVTADAGWMNSEDRAFPVVVDPVINASVPSSNVTDSYIDSSNPDLSYYSGDTYIVAGSGSSNQEYISYWMVDPVENIPENAYIISAKLNLYCQSFSNHSSGETELHLGIYRVTSNWSSGLTWNTMSNNNVGKITTLIDYATLTASSQLERVSWDITSLAKQWFNGSSNYGVAIKQIGDSNIYASFCSNEHALIPDFVVQYKDMKGLESYWTYSSHDIGFAGSGHVNLATGNLVLTKSLLSTTDNLMPYTLSLTYNSSMANKGFLYDNAQTAYTSNYMPLGFKLNAYETIIEKYYYDERIVRRNMYILSDADGTEHYFMPEKDSSGVYSTTSYQDEDGLQLKLNVTDDSITITDNAQNVRTYSKMSSSLYSEVLSRWYLSSITDAYGNKVIFGFTTGYRPNLISLLPNGHSEKIDFLNIEYNSASLPHIIWNPTANQAIVLRYSQTYSGALVASQEKYLRQIEYVHSTAALTLTDLENFYSDATSSTNIVVDATATYTYDARGRITNAKDHLSQQEIKYTLNGIGTVSYVTQYGVNNTLGQKIEFLYGHSYIDIRSSGADDKNITSDDIRTRYIFDNEGRVIRCYSMDASNNLLGATSGEYESQDDIRNNLKPTISLESSPTNYLLNGGFDNAVALKYWTTTANVSQIPQNEGHSFHANENAAQVRIQPYLTESLAQYTHIPKGAYTLSLDLYTFCCNGVSVYLKAESISDTTNTYQKEVSVNEHYGGETSTTVSMQLGANWVVDGGETFKISIVISGDPSVPSGAEIIIDNIVLSAGVGVEQFNLVQMGEFDNVSKNANNEAVATPQTFWTVNSGELILEDAYAPFVNAWSADAIISEEKYIQQTVYTCGTAITNRYDSGTAIQYLSGEYIVSGYAKATAAVPNGEFRLRVAVTYYMGNGNNQTIYYDFDFVDDCDSWQFVCGSFKTIENLLIREIKIICDYSNQARGAVLFDNISLVRMDTVDRSEVSYYEEGEASGLLKAVDKMGYAEYYEYNSKRQITLFANSKGEMSEYSYKNDGITLLSRKDYTFDCGENYSLRFWEYQTRPTITKTAVRIVSYVYNSYGQILHISTRDQQSESGALTHQQNFTYDTSHTSKTFGAMLSETDSTTLVQYFYDSTNGRLLATINRIKGFGTCYTYDAIGNITSVTPALLRATYVPLTNAEKVEYTYNTLNQLQTIQTESTVYTFSYNAFGATTDVSIGDSEIVSYEYNNYNGKLNKINYANGVTLRYVYTTLDNISEIWYNMGDEESLLYRYEYTKAGQLSSFDDYNLNQSTVYSYDTSNRLIGYSTFDLTYKDNLITKDIVYDDMSRTNYFSYAFNYSVGSNISQYDATNSFFYDKEGRISSWEVDGNGVYADGEYEYDGFDRLSQSAITTNGFSIRVDYNYYKSSNNITSPRVESYQSTINGVSSKSYTYTYDAMNNITKIVDQNGYEVRYAYNYLGQLIREDNQYRNQTYVYTYDKAGNILTKATYALTAADTTPSNPTSTISYTYGNANWGDQLTKYNGISLTYDAIGNPLTYYNGKSYTMSWENGRLLASLSLTSFDLSFEYNADGVRVSKTVNGTKHTYQVDGTRIISEAYLDYLFVYLYDAAGSPIGYQVRRSSYAEGVFDTYWYEKNLQGDIIAVYNASGTKLAEYTYDAWGNHTVTYFNSGYMTMAPQNPFRYRGYYYDYETGFYYLNSRYYDPQVGRFISPDAYLNGNGDIIGYNMYAYCSNNPVMYVDPTGQGFFLDLIKKVWNAIEGSFYYDFGVGSGMGGTVSMDGIEGTILWREDYVSLKKDPGEQAQFGKAYEKYAGFKGAGTSFTQGEEAFYDGSGKPQNPTPIEPDFDLTSEWGGQFYFFFGVTAIVGFDFEYFINSMLYGE